MALCLAEDDVNLAGMHLQKPVNPVDGLDKIIELVCDPEEYCLVAVALKVAAAASDFLFGGEVLKLSVAEIYNRLLALVHVLCAVDTDGRWNRLLNGPAFILEGVPQDKVIVRRAG